MEHRWHKRVETDLKTTVFDNKNNDILIGRVSNLSAEGMYIQLSNDDHQIKQNDVIFLRVENLDNSKEKFFKALVIHPHTQGIGLRTTPITKQLTAGY